MTTEMLVQAAHNNALWCNAVCAARGQATELTADLWVCHGAPPPFYPSLVTLSADRPDAQLAAIGTLGPMCAVKDSFHALDLAALGFRPLFDAQWIAREPAQPLAPARLEGVRWVRIADARELAAWEAAWAGTPDTPPAPAAATFQPTLLHDPDIAFIAGYQGSTIVAGVIANRTGPVVGLSNLFVSEHNDHALRAECLAALIDAFPNLPVVGYEHGTDLDAAIALGFAAIGPLRVWGRG